MHESNVVYNNLALEHILVGDAIFTEGSRSQITLIDFSKAREIVDIDGNAIKSDGVIYRDPTAMVKSFQKKSDIEALEKLMHELEVKVDLGVVDIVDYATPDYSFIKQILKERLSKEDVNFGKDFVWNDPQSKDLVENVIVNSSPKIKEDIDKQIQLSQ